MSCKDCYFCQRSRTTEIKYKCKLKQKWFNDPNLNGFFCRDKIKETTNGKTDRRQFK